MELALPAGAPAVERQILEVIPGAVLMLQRHPDLIALGGGQVGIFIHAVLELVHHAAVGDEGEGLLAVGDLILAGGGAEEQVVEGAGEELHAHGVALAGLHGGAHELGNDALLHGAPAGKGVARLVGQHVHVAGGAVEVGENEGGMVVVNLGAVAAGGLAVLAEHVQQLIFIHVVDEGGGLGAQIVVHLQTGGQDVVGAALGDGVAVGEEHQVIVELQLVKADALGLGLLYPGHDGHQVGSDLITEGSHLGGVVAVAAQTVVGQGDEVVVAHHAALGGADVDKLVIEPVQLLTVLVEEAALGLGGRLADGTVGALLVGAQLGQGHGLAVELHHGGGVQLLVLAGELILLLNQLHHLRLEGAEFNLQVGENQLAELLLQGGAEGGGQHGGVDLLLQLTQEGEVLVVEVVLLVVEFVTGVDGVADIGQVAHGADMAADDIEPVDGGDLVLHRGGGAQGVTDLRELLLQCIDIQTGIGHLGKFHIVPPVRYSMINH